MALEQLREDLLTFLDDCQVTDDVVQSGVDVDFVGRMEGANLDFEGVENQWDQVIKCLVAVLNDDNTENIISRIEGDSISLKKVVTVLGFAMEKHLDKTGESLVISLLAARMYLLLTCLQSSHVFGVYYKSMVKRAMAAFLESYKQKQFHEGSTNTKSKKGKKNQTVATENSQMPDETEAPVSQLFSPDVVKTLSDTLLRGLDDVFVFLHHDISKDYIEDVVKLIRIIVRFDYSASTNLDEVDTIVQFRQLSSFSSKCFALARVIMSCKFYKEDIVLSNFCLPRLIFKPFESENFLRGPLPQNMVNLAEVMVKFVISHYADPENVRQVFVKRLAENVIHHCLAERIDYRHNSIKVALALLENLPEYFLQQFCFFVVNYSNLPLQRSKLVAVDLICALLDKFDVKSFPIGFKLRKEVDHEFFAVFKALEHENEDFIDMCPGAKDHWEKVVKFKGDPKFNAYDSMMRILVRFTMDKVSAVRGRALSGLFVYANSVDGYKMLTEHAKHFLIDKTNKVVKILSEINVHDQNNAGKDTRVGTQGTGTGTPIPSQVHEGAQKEAEFITKVSVAPFVDLIVQRCNDKSVVTRKFTIPLIEAMLNLEKNAQYQKLLLEKIQDFCRDPSVQVRRLGAEALTRVVRDEDLFKKIWLDSLLPMVNDRDEGVEKACRKMFFDKIVLPIVANDGNDSLSWNLVIEIAKSSSFKRAFRRCFRFIAQDAENKLLLKKLVTVLYGAVKVDAVARSAWMLLDYLADAIDVDVIPAMHAWFSSDEASGVEPEVRIVNEPSEIISILSIIFKRKDFIEEQYRDHIRNNIAFRVINFKLAPEVVSDALLTFVGLMNVQENGDNERSVQSFCKQVIGKGHEELLSCPGEEISWPLEKRRKHIGLRLLTIGQAAMHAPSAITPDLIKLLFHILSVESPTIDQEMDEATRSRPPTRVGPSSQSSLVVTKIQGLSVGQLTAEITAAAVVAMGKIIISNEVVGREHLTRLIQVMGTSSHAAVRNNIIYTLADCYLRYTSKMDTLQKAFLHGLRDKIDYVRYHTLLLTTELLRSQYMKLTSLVVSRLLPLLLDNQVVIRDALEKETLAVIEDQFPTVYIDNFVTVMFLLNRVPNGSYKDIKNLEMPVNPLCYWTHDLSGEKKRINRMLLYKFMLKKFDDQQKFMLINSISRTIFGSIVDGQIDFDTPEVKQLLLDGFQVIEQPEAKLQLEEGTKEDDDEADLPPEELQKMAKKTIRVTFCHAFVQVIMPQFMKISGFLARKKSPLQKDFRNCLAVIAESYPEELDLLFKDNAQLKIEIAAQLKARRTDARKSRVKRNQMLVRNIANAMTQANKENEPEVAAENPPEQEKEIKVESNAPIEVDVETAIERTAIQLENVSVHEEGGSEQMEQENEQTLVAPQEPSAIVPETEESVQEQQVPVDEEPSDVFVDEEAIETEKEKTPERTLQASIDTGVEPPVPDDNSDSSLIEQTTPVGPPPKRRKSEISINVLQRQNMTLPRNRHLYADIPILSPQVTGIQKRIHSTPKRSTDNILEFTFGGDISMIAPVEKSFIRKPS